MRRVLPLQVAVGVAVHAIVLAFYLEGRRRTSRRQPGCLLAVAPLTLLQEYASALLQGQRLFTVLNWMRLLLPGAYVGWCSRSSSPGNAELAPFVVAWSLALVVPSVASALVLRKVIAAAPANWSGAAYRARARGLRTERHHRAAPRRSRLSDSINSWPVCSCRRPALGFLAAVVARAFANIPVFIATSTITIALSDRGARRSGSGLDGGSCGGSSSVSRASTCSSPRRWHRSSCGCCRWCSSADFGESVCSRKSLRSRPHSMAAIACSVKDCAGSAIRVYLTRAELSIWPWMVTFHRPAAARIDAGNARSRGWPARWWATRSRWESPCSSWRRTRAEFRTGLH